MSQHLEAVHEAAKGEVGLNPKHTKDFIDRLLAWAHHVEDELGHRHEPATTTTDATDTPTQSAAPETTGTPAVDPATPQG